MLDTIAQPGPHHQGVATAPLIKWPGGKRRLAPRILPFFPAQFGRYFEPFAGGAAIFFALRPASAVLSDVNSELINCYACVRDQPTELLSRLRRLRNTETDYYAVRASNPRSELGRAARLLYLTRLSFNGIHRVNLRGEFNVPYGRKTHLTTVDETALYNASSALAAAQLKCGDFEEATAGARAGDLVYFDPPYTVAHESNGFVKYNERIFSWADQVRLASHARALAGRGCHVYVSNAHHESISALYAGCTHYILSRPSVIAAASEHRRIITESLLVLRGN